MIHIFSPKTKFSSNYISCKNCSKSQSTFLLNMDLKSEFLHQKLGFVQRYKASTRPIKNISLFCIRWYDSKSWTQLRRSWTQHYLCPHSFFFFALHYQAGISKPSCSAHLHKSVQVHHEFESNLPCLSRATLQIAVISFFPYILHELAGLFLVFLCHTAMCRIVFLSVRLCNNSA